MTLPTRTRHKINVKIRAYVAEEPQVLVDGNVDPISTYFDFIVKVRYGRDYKVHLKGSVKHYNEQKSNYENMYNYYVNSEYNPNFSVNEEEFLNYYYINDYIKYGSEKVPLIFDKMTDDSGRESIVLNMPSAKLPRFISYPNGQSAYYLDIYF